MVGKQPTFGLTALIEKMTVWAPALPHYQQIAERLREAQRNVALTLYRPDDSLSPEEEFLSWLSTIDLHHGEYSPNPWATIEVYGATLTDEISTALSDHGADTIESRAYGFRASRKINQT